MSSYFERDDLYVRCNRVRGGGKSRNARFVCDVEDGDDDGDDSSWRVVSYSAKARKERNGTKRTRENGREEATRQIVISSLELRYPRIIRGSKKNRARYRGRYRSRSRNRVKCSMRSYQNGVPNVLLNVLDFLPLFPMNTRKRKHVSSVVRHHSSGGCIINSM